MTLQNGTDAGDAATLILPGAVGIGLGVLVGSLLSESLVVVAALALVGALAGHAVGYAAIRARSDRVE